MVLTPTNFNLDLEILSLKVIWRVARGLIIHLDIISGFGVFKY